MTLEDIDRAVRDRAAENRYGGWRHGACPWCRRPRMAMDAEAAAEIVRAHEATCRRRPAAMNEMNSERSTTR